MKKKKANKAFGMLIGAAFALIAVVGVIIFRYIEKQNRVDILYNISVPEYVDVQLLSEDEGSRCGIKLSDVKNIVIHYVGNPDTTAQQNHDYFANPATTVNSHFIIGLDGEVIQCIPLYERSSASNHRNKDTISIEVCHPDESGKFNAKTEKSLIKLTAWLCKTCRLDSEDVIRHYDVTGKLCPIYYVNNENEWKNLLNKIDSELK